METIINQVFWLWVPLSLLPTWLRIAIVTYFVIILARPILFLVVPKLVKWVSLLLKKGVELLSYPMMVSFHKLLAKRRHNGNHHIPAWLEIIEDLCAHTLKALEKIETLSTQRTRNQARIKRTVRLVAFALAVLLPLAIINNPTTSYSKTWNTFETWASVDKVQKDLDFDLTEFQANILNEVTKASAKVNPKQFTLTDEYKEGGNIRSAPTLDGKIIGDIVQGEVVTFLEEEETDDRNITWLKVETDNGKIGWVSANIVEEQ